MDLRQTLIESGKLKRKRNWKGVGMSFGFHGALVGLILIGSLSATDKVSADEKPIPVFVQQVAPPPPPPPKGDGSELKASVKRQDPIPEPVRIAKPVVKPDFVQPERTPKQIPVETAQIPQPVQAMPTAMDPMPAPASESNEPAGGVQGGREGGVAGGIAGGVQGGTVGGEVGGKIGGKLGGEVGGTGEGDAGAPAGPLRVGGDVKAPIVLHRVEPDYPDVARSARISGVVIVEAIINEQGNVEQVRIVKGLPMGLSDSAEAAVRNWKFSPGRMNGRPVPVIFNLTVVFSLDN